MKVPVYLHFVVPFAQLSKVATFFFALCCFGDGVEGKHMTESILPLHYIFIFFSISILRQKSHLVIQADLELAL